MKAHFTSISIISAAVLMVGAWLYSEQSKNWRVQTTINALERDRNAWVETTRNYQQEYGSLLTTSKLALEELKDQMFRYMQTMQNVMSPQILAQIIKDAEDVSALRVQAAKWQAHEAERKANGGMK